jgi:hypothetical protein
MAAMLHLSAAEFLPPARLCCKSSSARMAAVLSAPLTTSAPALTICRAKRILQQHESELHSLAKELLDKETLTGEQIKEMIGRAKAKAA